MLHEITQAHRNNTLRPRQNGQCFADDILKIYYLLYESYCILIPNGPVKNNLALLQAII